MTFNAMAFLSSLAWMPFPCNLALKMTGVCMCLLCISFCNHVALHLPFCVLARYWDGNMLTAFAHPFFFFFLFFSFFFSGVLCCNWKCGENVLFEGYTCLYVQFTCLFHLLLLLFVVVVVAFFAAKFRCLFLVVFCVLLVVVFWGEGSFCSVEVSEFCIW